MANSFSDRPRFRKLPDWKFWRHMPEVETWQACALALNFDPDSIQRHPQAWMAGGGDVFMMSSFPSSEVAQQHDKLLRLLEANRFNAQHFTPAHNFQDPVRLSEFAAWCIHVCFEIPPELAALAKAATQTAPKAEVATAAEGEKGYWAEKAKFRFPKPDAPAAKVEAGAGTSPSIDKIPGKIPKTANCKLAIKAAWQIEGETGKRATAKQVIEKLQSWVDHKDNPDAVAELIDKIPNGVKWVTSAGKENSYDIGACQKTLETWNKNRT